MLRADYVIVFSLLLQPYPTPPPHPTSPAQSDVISIDIPTGAVFSPSIFVRSLAGVYVHARGVSNGDARLT